MMRRLTVATIAMVVGAGGCGAGGDAGTDGGTAECQQIYEHVTTMVAAADRACIRSDDCVRFGGAGSCSCTWFLGNDCNGDPMNQAAAQDILVRAGTQIERYRELACSEGAMWCDCGPAVVDCVAGQCQTVSEQSCFPFDAGL